MSAIEFTTLPEGEMKTFEAVFYRPSGSLVARHILAKDESEAALLATEHKNRSKGLTLVSNMEISK
jgi:hypothetical protein